MSLKESKYFQIIVNMHFNQKNCYGILMANANNINYFLDINLI